MARVLIVGCGCRGRELARALLDDGHAVRGTTRDRSQAELIAAIGAEPWIGDPDRLATLTQALDAVTVVCWLLASAQGSPEAVERLHDSRLSAYLRELVDTTVRGFVYEAAGTVDGACLDRGREVVATASRTWQLPAATIDADPEDRAGWSRAAGSAVGSLLAV